MRAKQSSYNAFPEPEQAAAYTSQVKPTTYERSTIATSGSATGRRRPKLSTLVAADLVQRIVLGQFENDGQLPPEAELCRTFGVSRSVVRDAVRMLLARGLVHVRQGSGTTVAPPTDGAYGEAALLLLMRTDFTMDEVIAARAALEIQLAPLAAARGREQDWEHLEEDLRVFVDAVADGNWAAAHDAHLAFHLSILRAIHTPALEIVLKPTQSIILATSLPPGTDASLWEVEAHEAIFEALRDKDEAAARDAMVNHFKYMEGESYREFRSMLFRESPAVRAVLMELLASADD